MEIRVTSYLLRTIVPRPQEGLRVRLAISKVSSGIVTFDEAELPVATILSHGLFLAHQTPAKAKNPWLVSVLNQLYLKDPEPQTYYTAVLSSREGAVDQKAATKPREDCSNRLMQQPRLEKHSMADESQELCGVGDSISIWRNGMCKRVSPTTELGGQQPKTLTGHRLQILTLPHYPILSTKATELQLPVSRDNTDSSILPASASDLFVTTMHYLLRKQKSAVAFTGQVAAVGSTALNIYFERAARSLLQSLLHLKKFACADNPANKGLATAARNIQHDLYSLASVMLSLLVKPLEETLLAQSANAEGNQYAHLAAAKAKLKQFLEFGKKKLHQVSDSELFEVVYSEKLHSYRGLLYLSLCLSTLEDHNLVAAFFAKVESRLASYPYPPGVLWSGVELLANHCKFQMQYKLQQIQDPFTINGSILIGDHGFPVLCSDFVKVLRSSGDHSMSFDLRCKQDPSLVPIAILYFPRTRIGIFTEKSTTGAGTTSQKGSKQPAETVTHVRVWCSEAEFTTFRLEPTQIMGQQVQRDKVCQYFTGRYFLRYYRSSYRDPDAEIMILDLQPCLRDNPQPPVSHCQRLSHGKALDSRCSFLFECTDVFLSYIVIEFPLQAQEKHFRSVCLGIIRFSTLSEPKAPVLLNFDEQFQTNLSRICVWRPFEFAYQSSSMCWSCDLRLLYYVRWAALEQPAAAKILFVVCSVASTQSDIVQTITHSCYALKDLLTEEQIIRFQLRFSVLNTRVREYLVMDFVRPVLDDCYLRDYSQMVLARALFTVHKHKLHRVPVNNKLLFVFPEEVGLHLQYAGYNTSRLSLFHHRRLFSIDRVVNVLRRLDYKPL